MKKVSSIKPSVLICFILISVFAILLTLLSTTIANEIERKIAVADAHLETRIEYLEDRVGALCVIEYGKSTGFDRAMRGG